MLRSPLLWVGLTLAATTAALCLVEGEAAQPLTRMRTDPIRSDDSLRGGLSPATASAKPPEHKVTEKRSADATPETLGPKRKGKAKQQEVEEEPAPAQSVVSGRCVRDGQPIANMDFVLAPKGGKGRRQNLRTDENGMFRRGLPGVGEFELRAVGPGLSAHQPSWIVQLENGAPRDLGDLHLRQRIEVSGIAIADGGMNAAGVRVTLRKSDGQTVAEVDADADGAFSFYDVPDGDLRLEASHGNFTAHAKLQVNAEARHWQTKLQLRPRAEIAWTLRDDDGRPLAGAKLHLVDDDATTIADELGNAKMQAFERGRVRISADGCAPMEVEVESASSERRVVLARVRELRGKLDATAKGATVRISRAEGDASLPEFARAAAATTHAVGDDGSFVIAGLVAGRYAICAFGPNGCSDVRTVSLPEEPFVKLPWIAGVARTFVVRDERGEPVPFATAAIPNGADDSPARSFRADSEGRICVSAQGTAASMRLAKQGHIPTQALIAQSEQGGNETALTMQRATVLDGRLSDYEKGLPYLLEVIAWKKGQDPRSAIALTLQDDGSFHSGDEQPGEWTVAVRRRDRTHKGPRDGAQPLDVPLYADGIDTRTTTIVDARGGERTQLLLPLPTLPSVEGIVTRGGKPVAGAMVYATPHGAPMPGALAHHPLGFDHALAERQFARTTSDSNGCFRALFGKPGRYEFRVRTEGQPFATEPVIADLRAYTDAATLRLELPTAVVRGRFATRAKLALAFLVPTNEASRDPFRSDDGPSEIASRAAQRIVEDGYFEFPNVRPGDYVLRFATTERILRQRIVHVGTEPVDVGEVPEAPNAKPIELEISNALPNDAYATLLQRLPDVPNGAYCKQAPIDGAKIQLRDLPAGPYFLVLHAGGAQVGEPHAIELRGDGTAMPSRIEARR